MQTSKGEEIMSRNYFMIEKTDEGIFLTEGKGTETAEDYDYTKHWYEPEEIESEEVLFAKIKKLLKKS